MSKKTIAFEMPKDLEPEPGPSHRKSLAPRAATAEAWVHQQGADASSITLTISGTANWFEAAKIGFVVPYLVVWAWTLEATRRNLRLFAR